MSKRKPTWKELLQRFADGKHSVLRPGTPKELHRIMIQTAINCIALTPPSQEQEKALAHLSEALLLFYTAWNRHP